jgi:hypothetical protein
VASLSTAEVDDLILEMQGADDDPYWQALYQELLKSDLCLFAKDILGLEIGPHLVDWGDLIHDNRRIAINAARDHSKSTFFSYAYPIWRAWSEPGCEVYVFSATLDGAMEFLDIIIYGRDNLRGMIDIPELQHLVPQNEGKGTRTRLNRSDARLTNGSRIRAIGYGKKVRGRHPKYIICDDVLNDEDMWSETVRKKNIEYFKSAITNMLTPEGQLVCVGTPYHAADLWGFLRHNRQYTFKKYPGIIRDKDTGDERALFPWRWTLKRLYDKREEIGTVSFTREILCEPISDELSIFPSYLFPPLFDPVLTLRPSLNEIRQRKWSTYMGVDIARSANVGADYFVIYTIAKDKMGNVIICDINRSKGLQFRTQLEQISKDALNYDPGLIFIESNAMQQIYTDEMRRLTDLPVKEFITLATNKYPLDRGIPGLRILLENEKIIIPRGDEYSRRMTDIWIEEMSMFGYIDGKLQGIGGHDDTVTSFWFACEAAKAGGFSFAFGDEKDDDDSDDDLSGGDWESVMLGEAEEDDDTAFGT